MPEPIRVVLIDDDALVLQLLATTLEQQGLQVLWASGATAALEHLNGPTPLPDVLAVDIRMPDIDGLTLTRRILTDHPTLKVVMLTSLDDEHTLTDAINAGAIGYVVKSDPPERIALALRAATGGLRPFTATIVAPTPATPIRPAGPCPLTPREVEVLDLLSQSRTNGQIARELGISTDTVKRHVSTILQKLDAPDRLGAVMWGVRNGVITA